MTQIARCSCGADSRGNPLGADFQNRRYGMGNRVHNAKANGKLICTVCRSEKNVTSKEAAKTEDTKTKKK